jgi:hypothetical protein
LISKILQIISSLLNGIKNYFGKNDIYRWWFIR